MTYVAVLGAGAMGSYFAANLAEADNRVTVIDVDHGRLSAMESQGILVRDDRGERVVRVDAARAADAQGTVDLLVIFTKGMHTKDAARSVCHLVGQDTMVLTLQNGLGNDVILAELFGTDRVVIGMTDVPADLTLPNIVASHGAAKVVIGDYLAGSTVRSERIAGLLNAASFMVEVDAAVRSRIWEKVAFNAAMNAPAAITALTVGGLDSEPGNRIIAAAAEEVVLVAEAMGIPVDRYRVTATIGNALKHHLHHKPSMLQDVLAGRATEIGNINGAVVERGAQAGIATPVNGVLADLVRMIERAGTRRL